MIFTTVPCKYEIIYQVEIDDYIEYVTLSKKRRPRYYTKGNNIPKKYLDKKKYNFNTKGVLVDVETGEKIIANPKVANKPRVKKISGQDIWVGINHHLRSKIAREVKKYFENAFKNLKPLKIEDYPIGVCIDFYKPIGDGDYDLDNLSLIYRKCCHDALKGIIEDDTVTYLRSMPTNFIPVSNNQRRKMVITIFKIKYL
jgi:hypothetical protein